MDGDARWAACGRKRVYQTKRSAHRAAVNARKISGDRNIFEYVCPYYLDHFHIGHSVPKPEVIPAWRAMWLDAANGVQR